MTGAPVSFFNTEMMRRYILDADAAWRPTETRMKAPSRPTKRVSPAVTFRQQIEAALDSGAEHESLTLRLTCLDVSYLKRDQSLAVADISFAGGVMRFLGVKVEQDGVAASELICS